MGAVVPTITGLTSAITAVETLTNTVQNFGGSQRVQDNSEELMRAQQSLALQQLKAQQAADEKDLAQRTALDRAKIQADAQSAERERLAALRRAVARQRAAFGAQGIDTTEGSADAILLGLFDESDEDRQERTRLDDLRNRVLDQEQQSQKDLNILQVSQLRQRQRLARAAEGI